MKINKNNNIKNKEKNTKKKILNKNKKNKQNNIKNKTNTNQNNQNKLLIIKILFILFLILLSLVFITYINTKLTLKGNIKQTIEVNTEYQEPGFTALLFNKNINKKIKINSNLNTNKLGTYTITYKIPVIINKKATRTIKVIDTTKPNLTLKGNNKETININEEYIDKGITIEDNYDKDLSKNITIENNIDNTKEGTYTIKYTVTDSSNNINEITRTIIVKNSNKCNLSNPIEKYICENNYKVSIGYYNLNTNDTYYFKPDKIYYGASLIKTLDAIYLYDKNMINNELKQHVYKIITYSDNDSHHYLVNYIGKNTLKQYGIDLGAPNTLKGSDNYGQTTVKDQIVYMKKLYEITKDNQNNELKSYFTNSQWNLLKFNGSPDIMHKYGHYESVHHNAGIFLDENPYILVILTQEGHGNYYNITQTISKLIYEYHKKETN